MSTREQIDLGREILTRRKLEEEKQTAFPAFSRVVLTDSTGNQHVFWLVEKFAGALRIDRSWTGTAMGGTVPMSALAEGNVVSKNGVFGLVLDEYGERVGHEIPLPKRLRDRWEADSAVVSGCTHYIPRWDDGINGSMEIDPGVSLNFSSLKKFIQELEGLVGERPDVEVDVGAIEEELRAQKRRIQEFHRKKRERIRHIITSAALRNQPKLAAAQILVKQRHMLNGHVIIEGGPGTGKTTTLLDRIGLLTSSTIGDHMPTLSDAAVNRLKNPSTAYRLFTPTELLVQYLKEAMNAKGLVADSSKLTTWREYRDKLSQQMGLLTADTATSRFEKDRRAYRTESRTFDVQTNEWQTFVSVICRTFVEFVSRRHRRILEINAAASDNPMFVRDVQDHVAEVHEARSLADLIDKFHSLYVYGNELSRQAYNEGMVSLQAAATDLHARIRSHEEVRSGLLNALIDLQRDPSGREGIRSLDGDTDGVSIGRAGIDGDSDQDVELVDRVARSLLRKLALRKGLLRVRLTKRERTMYDHVSEWIDDEVIDGIAPKLLTGLLRAPCSGPGANVVTQVASYYIWLRRNHFTGRLYAFLHSESRERLARTGIPKGKTIGPDEMDLMLFLQLWLLRVSRGTVSGGRATTAKLSEVYEDSIRELVGIDEATDFSPVQLACMAMSANPAYECVTLCGDLMQRMTAFGLRTWEEYESVAEEIGVASVHRASLDVSYRQSYRLRSVTGRLYEKATGSVAPTRSAYRPSELDPPPLLHKGIDVQDCADWIAGRIIEIRRNYDEHRKIPTIAILVSSESSVDTIAQAVEEAPSLGSNIDVDPCRNGIILGQGSSVRVFNVKHIKGLEFEAAFFHDMGAIADRFPERVENLLYVGLSRASLYLGITTIGGLPGVLDPLVDDFGDGDWSV